jgi:Na+/melibiose symporter-like transporter
MGGLRAWRLGNTIEALAFLPIAFAGVGDQLLVACSAAVIGIGHGAARVLSPTEIAAVADEDSARTGHAREGLYFAAATFVEKCAVGGAVFGVGLALQVSGFVAGQIPEEATITVLRALSSVFPALLLATSCALLSTRIAPVRVARLEATEASPS